MTRNVGIALICLLSMSLPAIAGQSETKPLAVANGEIISADVIEKAAAEDLKELDRRRIQFQLELERERQGIIESTIEKVINERLLAFEAKKRKISVEDLIAIEVDSVTPAPADEAIARFYNENKAQLEGGLGENVVAIRQFLRQQSRQVLLAAFAARLRTAYGAKSLLEPTRTAIRTEGRPSKGRPDAPVTLVEFSDFQCPFCGALFPTLDKIATDYKDSVRVVYMQFPLAGIHPDAEKAAEASLCAKEQDKFWQFHDALFNDQLKLKVEDLKKKAAELSLNGPDFSACLDSGKYFAAIRDDVVQGVDIGVSGTPALFINGRILVGNQSYANIQKIIEDELNRMVEAN